MDHNEILEIAKKQSKNPDDVPLVETLHQNIAHMTVALKEVETRLLRVVNKMNRLKVHDTDRFVTPLAKCTSALKKNILETQGALREFE